MLRFTTCPKCGAQVEASPGVPCWSCGHVDGNLDPVDAGPAAFVPCKACGARAEATAACCWNCGKPVHPMDGGGTAMPDGHVTRDEARIVPFADLARSPPPPKQGILDAVAKTIGLKPDLDSRDGEPTEQERQAERDARKARTLLLFHCPGCGDHFKITFKKVHGGVKCPVCKDVKLLVPYHCTRCKQTVDFSEIGHHVCPACNIDMIPDPNFA